MDLTLSDEQRLLRESVDRFIAETYDADHRRRVAGDPLGFSPDIWKQFAELGWLALPIDEAYGGLGAGAIETGILMEAFGRGLVTEPYLSTVVIGASLIAECGSEAQKQAILPKVADGSLLLAFAHSERAARFDLAHVETTARRTPDGWRLDGHKTAVLDGNAADRHHRLGPPRQRRWRAGQTVPVSGAVGHRRSQLAGLFAARRRPRLQPRSRQAFVLPPTRCSATAATRLPKIEGVVDRALAALGAEAVGIMQIMLDMTLEYTKIRQQFGRPLSANQVIRHRLADMAMQCDEARSIALRAALMVDAEPVARGRAASGAKAKIGKCARFVAEQSVQLHGAMGVTEELDIGSYFKRLLAFDTLFGGSAHHYRRHAALGGRHGSSLRIGARPWISHSMPKSAPSSKKSATSSPQTSRRR